jgi:predicted ribosomally synthesized peptide with SipW-like signal peptide
LKRILFSVMSIMVVIGLVGGGAFAWFSDTETISGNTFAAGSLDLALSNSQAVVNGVIATASNMAPGVVFAKDAQDHPYSVTFTNVGTLPGVVTANFNYTEADASQTGEFASNVDGDQYDVSDEAFAAKLVVTEAYVIDVAGKDPTQNVAPYWAAQIMAAQSGALTTYGVVSDGQGGYLPTFWGLKRVTLHLWDTASDKNDIPLAAGDSFTENFKVKLDESATNEYQMDGINISIIGVLTQTNAPVQPWETVSIPTP